MVSTSINVDWGNVPNELIVAIAQKLSFMEDYVRLSSVSKSWYTAVSELSKDDGQKPSLPPNSPILVLAEQVAEGAILSCDYQDITDDFEESDGNSVCANSHSPVEKYDHQKLSVNSIRGLYRLSTSNTYDIELPEASGKFIAGTSKGWLLTLGIDLQLNLLHPLTRQQIQLPPMRTFPNRYVDEEDADEEDEEYYDMFIRRVAMSSTIKPIKDVAVHTNSSAPIIMAIYGESSHLGFAKIGDKVWTKVDINTNPFEDVTYYNGRFFAVNWRADVYVCDIDDNYYKRGARGTKIATCPLAFTNGDFDRRYLVESTSGELLLVWRILEVKYYKPPYNYSTRYRTINFSVWKLEPQYSDDCVKILSYNCVPKNNLGDEALFIGRGASISISSSKYIEPNCIYFTDDCEELFFRRGGGHDMGVFDVEKRTIKPFFHGKSIHPISPPLWYI